MILALSQMVFTTLFKMQRQRIRMFTCHRTNDPLVTFNGGYYHQIKPIEASGITMGVQTPPR